MSYNNGPRIVTDGLVLCLDAGNSKSYSPGFTSGWSGSFGSALNSFDGNINTYSGQAGGTFSATYTFQGGFSVSGTVRVYVVLGASSGQVGSRTNVVLIDGVDITEKMKSANLYVVGGWVDVTTEVGSVFNTIVLNGTSGSTNPGISAIEINGQILTSGNIWNDLSGNNNHGTLTNGPTYNANDKGSIVFDGTNDYCSIAHKSILNLTETFTISIWISPGNNTNKYILGKNNAYAIIIGYQTGNVNFYNLAYQPTALATQIPVNDNEFTHICYTKDLNALSNNWKAYKNNNNIFTLSRSFTNSTNSSELTIGSANPTTGYSQAKIAQVYLYNRALSATEVAQNYNATKGRFGL